jgi:hypothetical protein
LSQNTAQTLIHLQKMQLDLACGCDDIDHNKDLRGQFSYKYRCKKMPKNAKYLFHLQWAGQGKKQTVERRK